MTLAERLRREGEKEGFIMGFKIGVERGVDITLKYLSKFGPDSIYLIDKVMLLVDHCSIKTIESAIDDAQSISQLKEMMVAINNERRG